MHTHVILNVGRQIDDTTKSVSKGLLGMKRQLSAISVIGAFLMAGCVTVNLGKEMNGKRAQGVIFKAPSSPFIKDEAADVDGAWKNQNTGNVISYLSDCKDPSDPGLEHIVHGALSGLSEIVIEKMDSSRVQGRDARRVQASGKVDGVPSKIDLLTFKRNTCIYIISYVGVQDAFAADTKEYETFLRNFRAP